MELKLISDIPPSVNHYLAYRGVIKNGKPIASSYVTTVAAKYKSDFTSYVIEEVKRQGWNFPVTKTQHFYVDTVFYFPRVDMDGNNYFKVMLDAITDSQLIWADDNVVCERVQGIFYDTVNPRVELTITPVDYIGVFNDSLQLDDFISNNCIGCTRYTRNCSILNKAKSGKIQEECDGIICKKKKVKQS